MSNARSRKMITHSRELDTSSSYTLADLPELFKHDATLDPDYCRDWDRDGYNQAWLEWEVPETDEAWAARLAKLDKQAAKRADAAAKRQAREAAAKAQQEAEERELYARLKKKYG